MAPGGAAMQHMDFLLRGSRANRRTPRPARRRWGPSLLKFFLLANLVVAVEAEPMALIAGVGAVAPAFQQGVIDQFGGLQRPSRIAVSEDGEVFVADSRRGIVAIFDGQGQRVGTLGGLKEPLGLAVSVNNRCLIWLSCRCDLVDMAYVGDQSDGSVSVFENRTRVRFLGSGPGEFIRPSGIAVTAKQISYVVDSEARNIKKFARNGSLITTFGSRGWGHGQMEYPIDIAINERVGELYIADYGNPGIAVFDLDGAWLRDMWAPLNDGGTEAFFRISGLGIDSSGNLYVVDSALASVTILTPAGALIDIIGYQAGSYWTGDLKVPIDAATDGRSLYVTSSGDRLVKVFGGSQ